MITETAVIPQEDPTDYAVQLVALLSDWQPHRTKLKVLVERALDRLATDAEIAERTGIKATSLAHMRHDKRDTTFGKLYKLVKHDEQYAVLLLSALTSRGAAGTLYKAVNGVPVLRAQVIAAQAVLDQAARRYARRSQDPLPSLD